MSMTPSQPRTYMRFTLAERVEHFILMTSFIVLAVTGIPQKYVGQAWAETMIAWMGGIETTRQIHHVAAIVLILESVFHIVAVGYRLFVLRWRPSLLPGPKDLIDLIDDIRFKLGLAQRRPQMDRYTYGEKIEYWAVVWGTLIMAITGFMMWNPITTTRFLPGEIIPAAKAAHGGEALLAVLSIMTWHVYHVHLKRFNKSMFTGEIDEHEMEEEHPLELARIRAGEARLMPDREVKRRRERIYLPVATVLSLALLWGVYEFVTLEETAIATLPQRVTVAAFVPATPTPTPTPTTTPTPVPTPTGAPATPTVGATRSLAVAISHEVTGRENCLLCHAPDSAIRPAPADHAGRNNDSCLICHTAAGAETAVEPSPEVSFAGDVLPILQARCTACHGQAAIAGLNLATFDGVMRGGDSGPVVQPGDPDNSLLLTKVRGGHVAQFSEEEMTVVSSWIAAGAPNN